MNRRRLVLALAAALPSAHAQLTGRTARIGVITWAPQSDSFQVALRQGLRELGWEEGKNIQIEWRAANARSEQVDRLAAELVGLGVEVIVAEFTPAVLAARRATDSIPIVMAPAGDPVSSGLVVSLARPGGNVTGLSNVAPELAGKRLELLLEAVPALSKVGLLVFGRDPLDKSFIESTRGAATAIGMTLQVVEVPTAADIDQAFATLLAQGVTGAIVPGNLPSTPARTAAAAIHNRLPTIGVVGDYPVQGGLMAYAPNLPELRRRSAAYVDRILRGAKPQDLPVEQPQRFELVINSATAQALGMRVSRALLLRADRVIR